MLTKTYPLFNTYLSIYYINQKQFCQKNDQVIIVPINKKTIDSKHIAER